MSGGGEHEQVEHRAGVVATQNIRKATPNIPKMLIFVHFNGGERLPAPALHNNSPLGLAHPHITVSL